MSALFGRRAVLAALHEHVAAGHVVLLHGARGVGKSAVLHALARRCVAAGARVGAVDRTETLAHLVTALARAYPRVQLDGLTPARARTRLKLAVETEPCVLLLDHAGCVGTGFKSLLRSLRGTGSGVVIAADADGPREHQRLRDLHLTHREFQLPRLRAGSMRALLRALLADSRTPHQLHPVELERLLRAADGLPGRAAWFAHELGDERAWHRGRVRADWLKTEALAYEASTLLAQTSHDLHA